MESCGDAQTIGREVLTVGKFWCPIVLGALVSFSLCKAVSTLIFRGESVNGIGALFLENLQEYSGHGSAKSGRVDFYGSCEVFISVRYSCSEFVDDKVL